MTLVTLEPTPPFVIVTVPAPLPEDITVPALFTEFVVKVIPAFVALLLFKIKLPVPETPPDTVKTAVPKLLTKVVLGL